MYVLYSCEMYLRIILRVRVRAFEYHHERTCVCVCAGPYVHVHTRASQALGHPFVVMIIVILLRPGMMLVCRRPARDAAGVTSKWHLIGRQ